MYIFLFYGSRDNTLFLESSFENINYYENYQFNWWCAPLDGEKCPSCPSQSNSFFLFFYNFISLLNTLFIKIMKKIQMPQKKWELCTIPQEQLLIILLILMQILKMVFLLLFNSSPSFPLPNPPFSPLTFFSPLPDCSYTIGVEVLFSTNSSINTTREAMIFADGRGFILLLLLFTPIFHLFFFFFFFFRNPCCSFGWYFFFLL